MTATRLLRAVLWLLALLPLPLNHALGGLLGRVLLRFAKRMRRYAEVNLRLCFPELAAAERARLLRETFIETGRTFTELGPLWLWRRERLLGLVTAVTGVEAVDAAIAAGRGVVMACPHQGAWELGGLYCAARWPMTTLYRPPRLAGLEAFINQARGRLGGRMVPTSGAGIRALYRAVAEGEMVGVLPDQEPSAGNGLFAPFFGHPAYTMVLLARLAQKSGAAVFIGQTERLPGGRGYRIHFRPASAEIATAPLAEAVAAMNREIERSVREWPEQYQWSYPRFRFQPDGAPSPYRAGPPRSGAPMERPR